METITEENAHTRVEIAALLYANKESGFHSFMELAEKMLDKYYDRRRRDEYEARTHR